MSGPLLELSRPVRSCGGDLSAGHRGRLRPAEGWGLYDLHTEVPLEGCGVPHDAVLVVVKDEDGVETRLSLRDWSHLRRRSLRCRTCGVNVLDPRRLRARWSTPERRARCRATRARLERLSRLLRAALDARTTHQGIAG